MKLFVIPARDAQQPLATQYGGQQLPGWDPQWSRLVEIDSAADPAGVRRKLHVLDTQAALDALGVQPEVNLVALHGNPTWSYLWKGVAAASLEVAKRRLENPEQDDLPIIRVIAPDQLDMGFSARLAHEKLATYGSEATDYRTLGERIEDLDALITELLGDDPRPLFTLGHDWGGVISLGWASHPDSPVTGMITLNTAVHQPADAPIPAPLQAALAGPLLAGSTTQTTAFMDITLALGKPGLSSQLKKAYRSPYTRSEDRGGIGGFVADIPADETHRSYQALTAVAQQLSETSTPALMLWGAKDPVFLDRYQQDLLHRIPHVDLHRYERAGHLLAEDENISEPIFQWMADQLMGNRGHEAEINPPAGKGQAEDFTPMWTYLDEWADNHQPALVDMTTNSDGTPFTVSWAKLSEMVNAMAVGLQEAGLKPGDRVSMLVQPGRELTAALYAVLRAGGVAVVADAGLGIAGMTRAIKTAAPDWIIGELPGLTLAQAQRWPGRRLSVKQLPRWAAKTLSAEGSMYQMALDHAGAVFEPTATHPAPGPEDDAVVLFTSGSTGPAKGVRYTHHRISQMTQTLRRELGVEPGTSLLAGFAPFALLGPAIGATSVSPDMSVTKPATLTASALADAAIAGQATMVFASPAALRNIVATAGDLTTVQRAALEKITLMLSAGAPVLPQLMDATLEVVPNAQFHSPYGMTESLMVTTIGRQDLTDTAEVHAGVCVGEPISVTRLAIAPLDANGNSAEEFLEGEAAHNILGEVVISTPHMLSGYDKLWHTNRKTRIDNVDGLQWHRTGDIGHLDEQGRLWIEGRTQHVITSPQGPVGPGGPEARIDTLDAVSRSAVVGVGPVGTQAIVAVIEPTDRSIKPGVAPTELAQQVRKIAGVPVSAVLVTHDVPVDIRHNSKINRTRLADWASHLLSGGAVRKP